MCQFNGHAYEKLFGKNSTFSVIVSGVQRHAVSVEDRIVELALHLVDGGRDELETELGVGKEVVEQAEGIILTV